MPERPVAARAPLGCRQFDLLRQRRATGDLAKATHVERARPLARVYPTTCGKSERLPVVAAD